MISSFRIDCGGGTISQGIAAFILINFFTSSGFLGSRCLGASFSSSHSRCAGLRTSKAGVRPQRQMVRWSVLVCACVKWADRGRRTFRRRRRKMRIGGMAFEGVGVGDFLGGGFFF